MKLLRITLLAVLFGMVFNIEAQISNSFTFEAQLINKEQEPIANAYVYNKTRNKHTHSNSAGEVKLVGSHVGDTIQVGLLGYKTYLFFLQKEDITRPNKIELEEKNIALEELVISKDKNPLRSIVSLDLHTNPVNTSQEILRKVPGLFIGQHAGGGKAEQIFLRGFDIDHGTDISISVDGMPVNMVSHAHGQGYSDLHFVIPETIQKIDFGKGPYYANQGDFNTAGYVSFATKNKLEESKISLELGDFNSIRTLGMFNLIDDNSKKDNAYMALEYIETDGPFESSQNFNRLNLFAKYQTILDNFDKISITASHFTSSWDASGQIPQREVDNNNITRFGAIDDTEGGETSRSNLNLQYLKSLDNGGSLSTNIFASNYNFNLFSNFTFFLEDPINGDQIKQTENRNIYGLNATYTNRKDYTNFSVKYRNGFGVRHDDVQDVELSKTKNRRETITQLQLGDVRQTNLYGFLDAKVAIGKFEINPSIRMDYFNFRYNDQLQTNYETLSKSKVIVNPKLNIAMNASENLQLFVKSGIGFHSNDARVILQSDTRKLLPRAYGVDVGGIWKPTKNLVLNSALWYLQSEEELVYVGDAGIIEPSGESERFGIDLGIRYQLSKHFYFNSDVTLVTARSLEEVSGENFIPLAPDFTVTGGIAFKDIKKFSGGLRLRYLDNRPANEDNSIVAKGYLVNDFNVNYSVNKLTFGVAIENIFDVDWNETQFATTSRLQNETQPVEEIHFTPGTPLFTKFTISYSF